MAPRVLCRQHWSTAGSCGKIACDSLEAMKALEWHVIFCDSFVATVNVRGWRIFSYFCVRMTKKQVQLAITLVSDNGLKLEGTRFLRKVILFQKSWVSFIAVQGLLGRGLSNWGSTETNRQN